MNYYVALMLVVVFVVLYFIGRPPPRMRRLGRNLRRSEERLWVCPSLEATRSGSLFCFYTTLTKNENSCKIFAQSKGIRGDLAPRSFFSYPYLKEARMVAINGLVVAAALKNACGRFAVQENVSFNGSLQVIPQISDSWPNCTELTLPFEPLADTSRPSGAMVVDFLEGDDLPWAVVTSSKGACDRCTAVVNRFIDQALARAQSDYDEAVLFAAAAAVQKFLSGRFFNPAERFWRRQTELERADFVRGIMLTLERKRRLELVIPYGFYHYEILDLLELLPRAPEHIQKFRLKANIEHGRSPYFEVGTEGPDLAATRLLTGFFEATLSETLSWWI